MPLVGFRRQASSRPRAAAASSRRRRRGSAELGQASRRRSRASRAKSAVCRAAHRRRRGPRRRSRSRTSTARTPSASRRAAADDPRREPERRPRERPADRRDPPAGGRAGDRQRGRPGARGAARPRRAASSSSASRCATTFEADIVYVALHDPEPDHDRRSRTTASAASRGRRPPLPLGEGLTSQILADARAAAAQPADAVRRARTDRVGTPAQSYLGVPILVGDEAIGVVSVQSIDEEGRFGEADERLLATIAANVGIAIQNARLYREPQRRARRDGRARRGRPRDLGDARPRRPSSSGSPSAPRTCSRPIRAPSSSPSRTGRRFRAIVGARARIADAGHGRHDRPRRGHHRRRAARRGEAEIVNDVATRPRVIRSPGTEDDEIE